MYCSVKFFEPTVISMPSLSGFSSIRFALISLPASSVLPPVPQAATPSARTSAARSANSGPGRVWMLIWDSSLVGDVLVGERSGLVCDKRTPIRHLFWNHGGGLPLQQTLAHVLLFEGGRGAPSKAVLD